MSLNLENQGNLIAKVMKNGKDTNLKLFVTDKENTVRNGVTSFECKPDESLQIVPNNMTERQCLYICGQSGSGKSFFTTNYVKEYKKMFPKRNIYVISSIAEDKSIDSLKPKRINVMHSEFMFDEFTAEDFKDSLVIADDVDVFPTKIKKKVLLIINSILQIGRHYNVSLCFTTHNPTNGAET